MSYQQQDGRTQSLPQNVLCNIFSRLSTTSLFTASLVSSEWRKVIFQSGPLSNALLRPHLSVLRERFGFQQVPHRLPIPAVHKLLVRFAKQELFGTLCAKEIYNTKAYAVDCSALSDKCTVPKNLRRFAVCGSLLAIAAKNKYIYIFELTKKPMKLLTKISVKKQLVAISISEAYLAVLDEESVDMYSLLARNTQSFMVVHVYSIKIPQIRHPTAIAITPGVESTPLVAVLATSIYLIHPSYALTQKRGGFLRGHAEDQEEDITIDASRKGKEKQTLSRCISTKQNPWLLVTSGSGIGASFPLSFVMCGRQVSVSAWGDYNHEFQRSGYLGALWSNEDLVQLKHRQKSSLKTGENVLNATCSPDMLWRYYRARLNTKKAIHKETGVETSNDSWNRQKGRWHAHLVSTGGQMAVESAIHLYDSFYIVTEVKTRLIRIISMAPFSSKMILYRLPDSDSNSSNTAPGETTDKPLKHCGYAVIPGGKESGYIVFNHRPGYVKVLPLRQIPMHMGNADMMPSEEQNTTLGQKVTGSLREVAIGEGGDIVGIAGDSKRLVVVLEERVVVVRLWCEEASGRSVVNDVEPDWTVDRSGQIQRDCQRSLLNGKVGCAGCILQ